MPFYRCYRLNDSGHVFEPAQGEDFPDDDAARAWARDILVREKFFNAVALWQKTRLVAMIRRDESS